MLIATTHSRAAAPDEAHLVEQVQRALGFRRITSTLSPDESPTCFSIWSVRELQEVYARVGGAVTARPVARRLSDGSTYDVVELVLVADLGDLGTAAVVSDWGPADEAHGWALPVVQAAAAEAECPTCGAPAVGCSIPAHRPGSPCTVDYRAV